MISLIRHVCDGDRLCGHPGPEACREASLGAESQLSSTRRGHVGVRGQASASHPHTGIGKQVQQTLQTCHWWVYISISVVKVEVEIDF